MSATMAPTLTVGAGLDFLAGAAGGVPLRAFAGFFATGFLLPGFLLPGFFFATFDLLAIHARFPLRTSPQPKKCRGMVGTGGLLSSERGAIKAWQAGS
jgi:hypothetical protein